MSNEGNEGFGCIGGKGYGRIQSGYTVMNCV